MVMTPHTDGGPPSPSYALPDRVVSRLRTAVGRSAVDPAADDTMLRAAIADVAADARAREVRPEQLLPVFKTLIDSLPELHAATTRIEEARLRERMITLCIKSYFAPQSSAP